MNEFLNLFADTMRDLNQILPGFENRGNVYLPGIGPYSEDEIVTRTINQLIDDNQIIEDDVHVRPNMELKVQLGLSDYRNVNNRLATPDLVYRNNIIEFKLCRPLKNNGDREDTWFKKVFEPNSESYSAFLDVQKLCRFRDNFDRGNNWEKWVIIIGFERQNETEYPLDPLFPRLFDFISSNILNLPREDFLEVERDMGRRHPVHQMIKLYAIRY